MKHNCNKLIDLHNNHKFEKFKYIHDCINNKYDKQINENNLNQILDVIIVISNPVQFKRRYQLFEEFINKYNNYPKLRLHSTELQQGNKPFCTTAKYKFRTKHELWYKENLINRTVNFLPSTWKYMAWIDADIEFINDNWVNDTISSLQHYKVVQLFHNAIDLGPNLETLKIFTGIGYAFANNKKITGYGASSYSNFYHPGYAYAITRRCYNKIGGLIDKAICGSADSHMAYAFINKANLTINYNLHDNYKKMVLNFQYRCNNYIKGDFGYVPGTILHFFHGKKRDRQYKTRWHILTSNKYDPFSHVWYDGQGLLQLDSNQIQLKKDLRLYFRNRNEDSIDIC